MSTVIAEYDISDQVDEFCYDLAQAIRRILGLDAPDESEGETDV